MCVCVCVCVLGGGRGITGQDTWRWEAYLSLLAMTENSSKLSAFFWIL